jgi:hypothetical protein
VIRVVIASTLLSPVAAKAQGSGHAELQLGIGTFLSRDRGWNYGEPLEVSAAIDRSAGAFGLEARASFSRSFTHIVYPAVVPRPRIAYSDGVRAGVGVRVPSFERSSVSALAGGEIVYNLTEGEPRAATVAATAGIGLRFGPRRRGMIDLRYVRFAKRLGSSRGILPLALAWRVNY